MALNQSIQGGSLVLQGILSGLANDADGYLVDKLLPATPSPKSKGIIKVLDGGDMFGSETDDTLIAPGAHYPAPVTLSFSDVNFVCKKFGKLAKVPEEWIENSDLPIPVANTYLSAAVHYLKVMREARLASVITGATWAYANTPGAGDKWTASTSDPVAQLKAARDAMILYPNVLVLGFEAFSALQTNAKVLAGMPTTGPSNLSDEEYFAQAIARKLGIQRVLVWDIRKRAGDNPEVALTNANIPRIFSKDAWLGVMSQHPGFADPDGDLVLNPTAIARVEQQGITIEQEEDFDTDALKIKVKHKEAIQLVSANLGAHLSSVVA